jgi:hypothetical protein
MVAAVHNKPQIGKIQCHIMKITGRAFVQRFYDSRAIKAQGLKQIRDINQRNDDGYSLLSDKSENRFRNVRPGRIHEQKCILACKCRFSVGIFSI